MRKRALELVLILCMLLSMTAIPAHAATSGTCGENLTWVLDDNGTLTISGTGDMTNWSWSNLAVIPWYNIRNDITEVTISNGVTSIGDYAFYDCNSLTNTTIPNSVTYIGYYAFCYCNSLIRITIPNGVTSICPGVFQACEGLISVTIPNGITGIGDFAFAGCISLINVTIPNSVINIGVGAFDTCINLENITIPNGVTSIGYDTFFACESLTKITIPDSVTSIGNSAFLGCSNLTSITIPNSITSIGDRSFSLCYCLKDVYYKGTDEQWEKIGIGENNTQLTTANIHYNSSNNHIHYRSDLLSNAAIELNYSDSYFLGEKGYAYNLDLARASLALELSAFTPKKGAGNANIKKAYEYIGTDFVSYINYDKSPVNGEDKAAYSLATKKLSDGSTLIMVVLRGGGYGAEWRSNFHIGSGDFHNGFRAPADAVYSSLQSLIQNADIDTDTAKIWITGYSRGAAIANLVSGMINNNRLIKPENMYSYLFAVPGCVLVDNQNAKAPVHSNIFNMILPYDIVPKVAMSEWGYGRYGIDMYVKNRNSSFFNKNEKYFYNFTGKRYSVGKAQTTSGNIAVKALTNIVESKDTFLSRYEPFIMDMVECFVCHKGHEAEFVENMYSANSRYKNAKAFAYEECDFLLTNSAAKNLLKIFKISDDKVWQYVYPICVSAYKHNLQDRLDYIIKNNVKLNDLLDILLYITKIGTVADAHNPEYYRSWLFGYDNPKDIFEKAVYKAITVACPVDVSVYDKDGNLVLSVVDHETEVALIPAEISGDSLKLFIDSDESIEDYRIEIAAYEDGNVTYSVSEYEDYTEIRKVNYFDIDVSEGDVLCGNIPTENNCAAEEYNLSLNGEDIECDEDLSGEALGTTDIIVEVTGDGTAYGMEGVTNGELVVLNAYPMENTEFLGWYDEDENLLSGDEEYAFIAAGPVVINARFTEQPLKVKINDVSKIENGILNFSADVLSVDENEADIYTAFYDSNSVLLRVMAEKLTSGERTHNVSYSFNINAWNGVPVFAKMFLWNEMKPFKKPDEFSIINLE